MEKRSLFQSIFKTRKDKNIQSTTQYELLSSNNNIFTVLRGDTYDSKIARECIDRIATSCAKLVPKHIKDSMGNHIKGEVNFLLSQRPNPIMSTYDFIYKIVSTLYTTCNAFVYIAKDNEGMITGFYPVLARSYELVEYDSKMYLTFRFINGHDYSIPYEELIHLRLFYNQHDIFGTDNEVLNTDLQTAHTASEGIKNAIKTSNNLKGLLKFSNSMLKEKDLKASRDNFVNDFLTLENTGGIATLDAKADFVPINMNPIALSSDQLKQVNNNIFDYFGVSENIIKNSYDENEWNAYYEGVIEPRAIQLSNAFTIKIFSEQAIRQGHRIVFVANRLQYASIMSKTNMISVVSAFGLLTKNEAREILDLPPLDNPEEGEKIIQSLNNIDSQIANEYQGGTKNGENNEGKQTL